MVYFVELLDVKTNRLKIVRICARNVPRIHGHKRLDDNASLISLLLQYKKLSYCREAVRCFVLLSIFVSR